jgi:uncharacterized membrane protein YheB (UPF0754 family)
MKLVYIIPPLLGAFIGYLTNVIAVELLFHPKKPIGVFGFKIQGVVPARSREIIERMLDSLSEILTQEDFEFVIDRAITKAYLESKIASRLEVIFGRTPLSLFKNIASRSEFLQRTSSSLSEAVVRALKDAASKNIARNIDLREFVINKAQKVSDEEIEVLFKKFARKELRFIEFSGAVLGFLIGMIQSVLFVFVM